MNELKYFKRSRHLPEKQIMSAVIQVRIDDIRANRAQPRVEFDNNSIIRLADSIRRYGILQPLVVRESDESDSFRYELVAGERRLRAARLLGYFSVPCVIIEADEKMSAEMAIIENLLREDLNMFEEAYAFRQLIDNYSMTQEEVARKISLSQSAVANKLRLLKLSYDEQKLIIEYGLTERHARALLKISEKDDRIAVINTIHNENMNVAESERYIDAMLNVDLNVVNSVTDDNFGTVDFSKSASEAILSINKRIERFKRLGGKATVDVVDDFDRINVHIVINKK